MDAVSPVPEDATTLDAEPLIKSWCEVEVTADQPGEGFPPYRFVFRSDEPWTWDKRDRIIELALTKWVNGRVRTRAVIRHSWETDWKDGQDHHAAHDEAARAVRRHYDDRHEERAVWDQP